MRQILNYKFESDEDSNGSIVIEANAQPRII